MTDYTNLPDDLPVPEDDGAADHLRGQHMPVVRLPDSSGERVNLGDLGSGRSIVYLFPLTGQPNIDLPRALRLDPQIPRMVDPKPPTPTTALDDRRRGGVGHIHNISSQPTTYPAEVVERLRATPHDGIRTRTSRWLPNSATSFSAEGKPRLYTRLTLVVTDDVSSMSSSPIFPPNTHAQQVLKWVQQHPI